MNDEQVFDFGIRLWLLREERGLSRMGLVQKRCIHCLHYKVTSLSCQETV